MMGTLTGETPVASPFTGLLALLVEWRVWNVRTVQQPFSDRPPTKVFDLLAAERVGETLLVTLDSGELLRLEIGDATRIDFVGEWDPGPVPSLLPDGMVARHPRILEATEELGFDEKRLTVGTRVEIVGQIEKRPSSAGYRSNAISLFVDGSQKLRIRELL